MELREGDVVLVRGRVALVPEEADPVITFKPGWHWNVPPEAITSIEVPDIAAGDRVAWTGKDRLNYAGVVLSVSLEPTGTAWAWVRCPAVSGGFATLKTTELRRA